MNHWDVVVIGAGAAGMMCALHAGYRGRRVLLIEHTKRAGRKILMSGGGRCNFTNMATGPQHFYSANPHFCKSALKRYTPGDFVEMVERHGIEPVEKAPGQLFCADSSQPIVDMLLTECSWAGVELRLSTRVDEVDVHEAGVRLATSGGEVVADRLVVATGGLSIPTLGATGFAFDLARRLGLAVVTPRPALVPLTLGEPWKARMAALSGLASEVEVRCRDGRYREPLLLTHRGLSGPSILKASNHWWPGDEIAIDWLPAVEDIAASLRQARAETPSRTPAGWLGERLPKRLSQAMTEWLVPEASFDWQMRLSNCSNRQIEALAAGLSHFRLKPAGSEGWRTAEVTMGGIDTAALSSKDFSVKSHPRLHFVGEALDVTGQLGGHNLQWAWASGVACAAAL
ncbi:NAD(P)/FAD-dependent oxidoreductase [Kushneria aurantia]|uniref:NAD(P)/FAD-dependent oxidoreductase n=1 Tax=Kushneria aurantia TaxID=504092 RepID=A0ABV6G7M2_9GAMM|nr:NAD(P)/FAD-dependent oxidoreductase [Kushneria aurantia]